jgi:hypothetical protein
MEPARKGTRRAFKYAFMVAKSSLLLFIGVRRKASGVAIRRVSETMTQVKDLLHYRG